MNSEYWIQFSPDGPLRHNDVETAVRRLLDRLGPQPCLTACLVGRDAMTVKVCFDSPQLQVKELTVRTRSGWRVRLSDCHVPLPNGARHGTVPIDIGVVWDAPRPISDGSTVRCKLPRIVLATGRANEDDTEFDGVLRLGTVSSGSFSPAPVAAERIDGCPALREWFQQVAAMYEQINTRMAGIIDRLTKNKAPVLRWLTLLQPIAARLETLKTISTESSPFSVFESIEALSAAVARLLDADMVSEDPHLARLLAAVASRDPPPIIPPSNDRHNFANRCECSLVALKWIQESLDSLASPIGVGLRELPLLLYHEGQLFRQRTVLRPTATQLTKNVITQKFDTPGNCWIASLWDLQGHELVVGDIRFVPHDGAQHRSLHSAPVATEYHWLDSRGFSTWEVDSPRGLELLDMAAYCRERACD